MNFGAGSIYDICYTLNSGVMIGSSINIYINFSHDGTAFVSQLGPYVIVYSYDYTNNRIITIECTISMLYYI